MASWPTYDPNAFTPTISAEKFKALQDDPDIPLLPRAFRSAYPPGSVFKVAVGIAALESGLVRPDDEFDCLPVDPDRQSHFSQLEEDGPRPAELRAGADGIVRHLVLSGRHQDRRGPDSWIGRNGSASARSAAFRCAAKWKAACPTDEYMKATHGRKLLNGDIANLSIGQGDAETTPLQMAQAMAIIGNGGTFYQTRLVQQVQTVDNEIVTAFQVRDEKDTRCFTRHDGAIAGWIDQRGERAGRHRSSGESGKRGGGGENRHGAVGPEEQGAHGGVVCGVRAGGEDRSSHSPRFTKGMSAPTFTVDRMPRR